MISQLLWGSLLSTRLISDDDSLVHQAVVGCVFTALESYFCPLLYLQFGSKSLHISSTQEGEKIKHLVLKIEGSPLRNICSFFYVGDCSLHLSVCLSLFSFLSTSFSHSCLFSLTIYWTNICMRTGSLFYISQWEKTDVMLFCAPDCWYHFFQNHSFTLVAVCIWRFTEMPPGLCLLKHTFWNPNILQTNLEHCLSQLYNQSFLQVTFIILLLRKDNGNQGLDTTQGFLELKVFLFVYNM